MGTGKGVADTVEKTKKKFKLVYSERLNGPNDKPAGKSAAHNIGATIRNRLQIIAPTFLSLPKEEMYRVVVGLKETHEWEKNDIPIRRWVLKEASSIYKRFKGECSKAYKTMGAEVAREVIPVDFINGRNYSWTWLCEYFATDQFQRKSTANVVNRGEVQMVHHGGPTPVAYRVQALERESEPFPLFRTFEEKYVKGAQEGPAYELHAALRAEADRRVHAYMEQNGVDIYVAMAEVGKTEKDIVKDVKEARNPRGRKVDLDFMGQIGQPSLSQAPTGSRSSRARSGRSRRSSGSSSQGEQASVPSPTPRELELEKKIAKMQKKQKKNSSWKKKLLGALKFICADKGSGLEVIDELEREAEDSSDDDMSLDETGGSEEDEQMGQQAEQQMRDAGGSAVPPAFYPTQAQTFYPHSDPADMSLDQAVNDIFDYPMPPQTMIPTPGWHQVSQTDQETTSSIPSARKDKGKKKMQVRRSARRARNEEIEEAGSSPEA